MAQSILYPIRYPIQPNENIKATEVFAEGGLDLTQSIIENRPGCASSLTNFEVSLTGGYRRISGYQPFSNTIVPGQGQIIGVAVFFPNTVVAARQDASDATKYNLYSGGGTTWTRINPIATTGTANTHTTNIVTNLSINTNTLCVGQPVSGSGVPANTVISSIDSISQIHISHATTSTLTGTTLTFAHPLNYTAGMIVNHCTYNWTGTSRLELADGVNSLMRWDGTTFTIANNDVNHPTAPTFCIEFSGYMIVGGFTENDGAIAISAPLNDLDWTPVDGAATIVVGHQITWLKVWRHNLVIFCKDGILVMIGNSTDTASAQPFTIQQITDKLGCIEGRTVREINGDLVFLAPDGIRTISGTINIGDTEISSISRPIQSIVNSINSIATPCHSVVIAKKTQYRLFYPIPASTNVYQNYGIVGGIRRFRDGHEGWEWGQLQGIKPSCCDSAYLQDDNEYVVHGGYDGYVYRQEEGTTFNGTTIQEIYTTVPLELGDFGLRKVIHRVTVYVTVEGAAPNLFLKPIYDYDKPGVVQPIAYKLMNIGSSSVQYDSSATYDNGFKYDTVGLPVYRQSVQGSGFVAQLPLNSSNDTTSNDTTTSYIIQGYYIEFYPGGRR